MWTIASVRGIIFHEIIEHYLLKGVSVIMFNRTQLLFQKAGENKRHKFVLNQE